MKPYNAIILILLGMFYASFASAGILLSASKNQALTDEVIELYAEYPPGFVPNRALITADTRLRGDLINEIYNIGPFTTFSIKMPTTAVGIVTFKVIAFNADKTAAEEGQISITVLPDATAESLSVMRKRITLSPPGDTSWHNSNQIKANASYSDGISREVNESVLGVTYDSSTPTVAAVTSDGLISAVSAGTSVITVKLNNVIDYVGVEVKDSNINSVPPEIVSDKLQIRAGGFRYDRARRIYLQEFSVTNVSAIPIVGVVSLVFSNLAVGVKVVGPYSEETRFVSPIGSSYIELDHGRMLYPNQSSTVVVEFKNGDGAPITYTVLPYVGNVM